MLTPLVLCWHRLYYVDAVFVVFNAVRIVFYAVCVGLNAVCVVFNAVYMVFYAICVGFNAVCVVFYTVSKMSPLLYHGISSVSYQQYWSSYRDNSELVVIVLQMNSKGYNNRALCGKLLEASWIAALYLAYLLLSSLHNQFLLIVCHYTVLNTFRIYKFCN